MMEILITGASLVVGLTFYIFIAIAVHDFTINKWGWSVYEPGCFFAGTGWPIFILFWLVIGHPFIFVYRLSRRLLRILSSKKTVSEVK